MLSSSSGRPRLHGRTYGRSRTTRWTFAISISRAPGDQSFRYWSRRTQTRRPAFARTHDSTRDALDPQQWESSPYRPSPSIIEAAEELFAGHAVREIAHAHSDNLTLTARALTDAIHRARDRGRRTICFVTGVPGAGKTLAGLNSVHDPSVRSLTGTSSVFLSGNGPLVRIVRAALARQPRAGLTKQERARRASAFIQNVHTFIEQYGIDRPNETPCERVVVFDEAQRAWNAEKMRKKYPASEPRMLLEIMERCADWCAVTALVGGGQEIHEGEAGLAEWGRALAASPKAWNVVVSPEILAGGASLAGSRLFESAVPEDLNVHRESLLHLAVSQRSYRAQAITEWVNHLLDGEADSARDVASGCREFPIALTRSLATARSWLRERTRGEHRPGLVTSSGNARARAYGIEVSSEFRHGYPFEFWFLAPPSDVRSSFQLEVAATEFECQGLEVDWTCVCWGDDLCRQAGTEEWVYRRFRGNRWIRVRRDINRRYLLNKYRVLLTRAREGTVLWVPPGADDDPTRDRSLMDATAEYLHRAGAHSLD